MDNSSETPAETTAETMHEESITKEQKSFFKVAAISVLVIIVIMIFKVYAANTGFSNSSPLTGSAISTGESQAAKMYVQNGKYIIEPSTFTKGVPVRIEADISRMPGCSKSIVIQAFNVRKNLNSGNNIIEFTPNKAGTFNIACSMNMYKGSFTILESDGSKSDFVEQAPSGGSTCGAGGGCGGCGG